MIEWHEDDMKKNFKKNTKLNLINYERLNMYHTGLIFID